MHGRRPPRRFVVSAAPVWGRHGEALAALTREEPILLPDGERYKNVSSVQRIYDALIRASADRATCIIAFGGGVVGDITGFAAATFLRGVPVVQVPTTLLAQVDSAIGGKTGVNHPLGKNLIGAYHQPLAVLIDPVLLGTLPRREFRAGLYEVVKYGIIASRPLFDRLLADLPALFARDPAALVHVIAESCRIKADVVGRDERESGPRRALNFGHTAGHALEAVTKYKRFRHGEAVAYGMLVAAELGVRRGTFQEADRQALRGADHQDGPAALRCRSVRGGAGRGDGPRQEGGRRPAPLRPAGRHRRHDGRHGRDDGRVDGGAGGDWHPHLGPAGSLDAVFLQLRHHHLVGDAEQFGGAPLVAVGLGQHQRDLALLGFRQHPPVRFVERPAQVDAAPTGWAARRGPGASANDRFKWRGRISSPSVRITARSMQFCSSRTFPGQRYACRCSDRLGRQDQRLLLEIAAEPLDEEPRQDRPRRRAAPAAAAR